MSIHLDGDLQELVVFMQRSIPASKLLATAEAVALLAPVIWGHHEKDRIIPAMLLSPAISLGDPHKQPFSSEPRLA